SIVLIYLPDKYPGINVHAKWYGFSFIDIIFPAFVTIFGTSMAIAYHKGVKKKRLAARTLKLLLFGLLFNMIVNWNLDIHTIRLTGVLQLFAVVGLLAVLVTRFVKKTHHLILVSILIFLIHGLFLMGNIFCSGLPQPFCNPSAFIDYYIFGKNHLYVLGEVGYDPEGIPSMFGALGNALLGFVAGKIILQKKSIGPKLYAYASLLFVLCVISLYFIPMAKRLWTPSFGFWTAGITVLMLATCYVLFEKADNLGETTKWTLGFFIAFGRNSFLLYFGKYLLNSLLAHVQIFNQSILSHIMDFLHHFYPYDSILYMIL